MPLTRFHPQMCLLAGVLLLLMGTNQNQAAGMEPRTIASSAEAGPAAKTLPLSLKAPFVSGREIGEYVPTFYTRVVTGPLMNRSVCYVCRNGQRPVVMVLLRKLGKDLQPLLKQVDRLVDQHRAEGLRSFAVYISESPSNAISDVQTFSFDHQISLPLTVGSSLIAEPHCQNLNAQADVTVVLYQDRRVVRRFAFREGEIESPQVEAVTQSIRDLLKPGTESESQAARN